MSQTIDMATARRMAEAGTLLGVSIIGQPGGWSVMLKTGKAEKPLGGQKTDRPRTWRSLDALIAYLREDLHIVEIDGLDATHHHSGDAASRAGPDAAERMRCTHEAAAYDAWFRAEVEAGIKEADDPNTEWISNEEAEADWEKQRAALVKRVVRVAKGAV